LAKTAYSQQGYPKRLVLDGDTIIAITPAQRDSIMSAYYGYDECIEIGEALTGIVKNNNKKIAILDSLILTYKFIEAEHIEIIELNARMRKTLQTDLTRSNRRLKLLKIGGGITIGATLIAIVLLSTK
jgi:hypothetical protein